VIEHYAYDDNCNPHAVPHSIDSDTHWVGKSASLPAVLLDCWSSIQQTSKPLSNLKRG
jgi:hypothetical protein